MSQVFLKLFCIPRDGKCFKNTSESGECGLEDNLTKSRSIVCLASGILCTSQLRWKALSKGERKVIDIKLQNTIAQPFLKPGKEPPQIMNGIEENKCGISNLPTETKAVIKAQNKSLPWPWKFKNIRLLDDIM